MWIALTQPPKVAPLPAAQIFLAGLWSLTVQEFLCQTKVVQCQRVLESVHIRSVGPLAGRQLSLLRALAFVIDAPRSDG